MMGEISPVIFWNVVLTLVIAPAIWMFRNLMGEVKRIDILLNRTREDYSTKQELREDMHNSRVSVQHEGVRSHKCLLYAQPHMLGNAR